jgi:hypothetical protein
MFKAEKLKRQKTGLAGLGWSLGDGYVREKTTIKYEAWCVTGNGAFFAECKSQQAAIQLANKLNKLRNFEQMW